MKPVHRIVVTAVAVGALLLLGWRWLRPRPSADLTVTAVTLWTAGPASTAPRAGRQVALPEATQAPAEAERIPDVAFLRRRFPALTSVAIEGEGVDEAAAARLRGLAVTWQRPERAPGGLPEIANLSAPAQLHVGQPLSVQGRITGLRPKEIVPLSLEAPDGSKQALEVRAAANGEAEFAVKSAVAAVAPGAFEWKLRVGPNSPPFVVGAWVVSPVLPRVLILQAAPNSEAGRLQRWLAHAGASVTARTRVSAESVRFTTANGASAEFATLNAAVLAGFDVVVTRALALRELPEEELAALEIAVREEGVGLIVVCGTDNPSDTSALFPWKFRPLGSERGDDEARLTRIRLEDGTEIVEPVNVPSAELIGPGAARPVARDSQQRPLVAAVRRGQGWVVGSLVGETWRWLQGGHPEAYAAYWSVLLSAVARPAAAADGRWTLAPEARPLLVGESVALGMLVAPTGPIPAATLRRRGEPETTASPLHLLRDPREPSRVRALVWPSEAGWHEARALPGGAAISFYVHEAAALPAAAVQARHDVTGRLVQSNTVAATAPNAGRTASTLFWWEVALLALFVGCAGWLWLHERNILSTVRAVRTSGASR